MTAESFILYTPQYNCLKDLSNEQLGQLLRSLYLLRSGQQVQLNDNAVRMAFAFITNQFRYDDEKRERYIAQRKAAAQASVNARKQPLTNANNNVNSNVNNNVNDNKKCMCINRDKEVFQVFKKFFFRNMLNPTAELKRYYDWGESTGWVTKNGTPIKNRVTYASFWRPEQEGNRFSLAALGLLRQACRLARETDSNSEKAVLNIVQAVQEGETLAFYGSRAAEPAAPFIYKAADQCGLPVTVKILQR